MAQARSLVGLDVHASKIVAAVLDAETGGAELVPAWRLPDRDGELLLEAAGAGPGGI